KKIMTDYAPDSLASPTQELEKGKEATTFQEIDTDDRKRRLSENNFIRLSSNDLITNPLDWAKTPLNRPRESISISVLKTIIKNFRPEVEKIIEDKKKLRVNEKPKTNSIEDSNVINIRPNTDIYNFFKRLPYTFEQALKDAEEGKGFKLKINIIWDPVKDQIIVEDNA
ncbi:11769_t:CDS:2, partial [Racocetra persica]